jgi:hypothetical protein
MFAEGEPMHQRSYLSANSTRALIGLALTSLSAVALLSGCDGGAYNLGEDEPVGEQLEGACDVSIGASGTLVVQTQADVDALSGCRELPGNLFIDLQEGAESLSLAALAELEVVRGVLSIDGPLTSLVGLEALEQISGLSLEGLLVSDLTPLRGLVTMERQPDYRRIGGTIRIAGCDQLVDLAGLENLAAWESLSIESMLNLETLAGLQSPSRAETIEIRLAPRLSDVSALAGVEEVSGFMLARTAVESLDDLRLEAAEWLHLGQNHLLTDLDGLRRLRAVGSLEIQDNDALLRVELRSLDDFEAIWILDNAVLEAIPHYSASRGTFYRPLSGGADTNYARFGRRLFEVGDNPQLRSVVLPTDFSDIEQIAIYRNTSLTALDLGFLRRSDGLSIQDNATLGSVLAPALQRVADLAVKNNPALSVAPFANVQTFTRDVSGNLDEPAP